MPPTSSPTLPTVRASPRVSFWRSRNGRATSGLLALPSRGSAVRATPPGKSGGTLPEELLHDEGNFYRPHATDRVGLTGNGSRRGWPKDFCGMGNRAKLQQEG